MSSCETQGRMSLPMARSAVVEAVVELVRLGHRLFEIGESLAVPWDVVSMWDKEVAPDSTAELAGAIRLVRTDLVQEAISRLSHAACRNDADLRFEFRQDPYPDGAGEEEVE